MIIKNALLVNKKKFSITNVLKAELLRTDFAKKIQLGNSNLIPTFDRFNNLIRKNKNALITSHCKFIMTYGLNYSEKIKKNDLKNNEESIRTEAQNIFDYIFDEFKFDEIISDNKKEKILKGLMENKNFIYGEATFQSTQDIIDFIESKEKDFFVEKSRLFLDIGSGTGKAVIGMSLLNKFAKCVGVEIMENLHFKSELAYEKLISLENKNNDDLETSAVEFILDDIMNTDFSKFDVIFANSTCWTKDFINQLHPKLTEMKKGAFFFNTDQVFYPNLDVGKWEKYEKFITQMSWGDSNVFVIKKL